MFASDIYCPSCGRTLEAPARQRKPDWRTGWKNFGDSLIAWGASLSKKASTLDRRWLLGSVGIFSLGLFAWMLATLGGGSQTQESKQSDVAVAVVDSTSFAAHVDSVADSLPAFLDSVRLSISNLPSALFIEDVVRLSVIARSGPAVVAVSDPVSWRSSDNAVARVNPNGQIVGVAEGEVTITATSGILQTRAKVRVIRRADAAPRPVVTAPTESTTTAPVDSLADVFRVPQRPAGNSASDAVSDAETQSAIGLIRELLVSRRHRRLGELCLGDQSGGAAIRDKLVDRVSRATRIVVASARAIPKSSADSPQIVPALFAIDFEDASGAQRQVLELRLVFETDGGNHRFAGFRITSAPTL
jgi:hypothetical protein